MKVLVSDLRLEHDLRQQMAEVESDDAAADIGCATVARSGVEQVFLCGAYDGARLSSSSE